MAKYNGLITIEGQIDGLSFYKTADGTFVRRAGGVKKSRIMNDSNFARTRENMSEFSEVAKSNKLMRNSFGYLLEKYKDSKMQARLTSKLYEVLRNDTVSDRGERSIAIGIGTEGGVDVMRGFDFNARAPLSSVLFDGFTLDMEASTLTLTDVVLGRGLKFPAAATDFNIRLIESVIRFEGGNFETHESNVVTGKTYGTTLNGVLSFESPLTMQGQRYFLLVIEYLQEVNGNLYPLNNGAFNVVNLLDMF